MAQDLTTEDTESTEDLKAAIRALKTYARLDAAEIELLKDAGEAWREMAGRLALACIADGGDFREDVLRDYRKMIEEGGR
jgi:hypothetical protein